MKHLLIISIFLLGLLSVKTVKAQCDDRLIEVCYPEIKDFKFIKHYPVKFKKSKKDAPLTGKNVVVLNQGVKYRFVVCNASDYSSQLVLQLHQSSNNAMMSTTYDASSNKVYNDFEFVCKSSGVYYLIYFFQDGKEGCAVILMAEK